MKVILNKTVAGLGEEGDVVAVKGGFARNYLLPMGIAKNATKNNIAVVQNEINDRQVREAKTRENLEALTKQLDKLSLKFELVAGEDDRLFGSVTSQMIADAIAEKGYTVAKKEIEIPEPIKHVGKYFVHVKLGSELDVKIKVKVAAQK
jgi:large subunit ribosomal protein L9